MQAVAELPIAVRFVALPALALIAALTAEESVVALLEQVTAALLNRQTIALPVAGKVRRRPA